MQMGKSEGGCDQVGLRLLGWGQEKQEQKSNDMGPSPVDSKEAMQ